ncbi:hypothetical protein [Halobacillus massiliensis]|uniref:hypothetical protein n=1 Tax=Halobacillus massiliensis TaxID=1926286 RepID=UPI0009E4DEB3|nr:hypothetical protein [Halobacillus massiliensis]
MDIRDKLELEANFLRESNAKSLSISINTTSKHAIDFRTLPRRMVLENAMSSFMINNENYLIETLNYFDGIADSIFIDIERKQLINLYEVAKQHIKKSKIVAIKPNDTTLESCDLLTRNLFNDDLHNKKIVVVGTGNLAGKIALRLAERQANVYIKGRTKEKERLIVDNLNSFLPKFNEKIKVFSEVPIIESKVDLVISFLSGQFEEEHLLYPIIDNNTYIIDGGINNFSKQFIRTMLSNNIPISRLDSRMALPYQFLSSMEYTNSFLKDIYGKNTINGYKVVAGGVIGAEGVVILDNIKNPKQIIGIADGRGGIKKDEQLTEEDRESICNIKKTIS